MEKIIINDYINSDPLIEENLDETLKYVNKIRLSCPNKTIWIYTGFSWEDIWTDSKIIIDDYTLKIYEDYQKRQQIISKSNILIDGKYIDSQRNPSLRWRGSENQRVIDIQESLKQNKVVLYCD